MLQFGFSAGAVRFLKAVGVLDADTLSFTKVRLFAPAVLMFYAAIAANMRLLSKSTVDTFIVVRSVTPIFTQVGEILFFGADWPSQDEWLALLTISVGAVGFAYHNIATIAKFPVIFWALVYLLCITADTLVVKRVVTHVELSPWGYVYYNNFLALSVYPAWAMLSGEATRLAIEDPFSSLNKPTSLCAVGISCILGLGISFFGLNARRALSATAFTVLGVSCKFISVLLNMVLWHHHAPHAALPWLFLALSGSVVYQRANNQHRRQKI